VREEGEEGEEGGVVRIVEEFIISLGIRYGHGAFPVPRERTVLSNLSRVTMSVRVTVGSPRGVITNESGSSDLFHGGRGRLSGVARVSSLSKWEWTAAMTALESL
jgi:hypothetical protein